MSEPLKAGRELDALIAEKVFGVSPILWHPAGYGPEDCYPHAQPRSSFQKHPCYVESYCDGVSLHVLDGGGLGLPEDRYDAQRVEGTEHTWHCLGVVPDYSTSISDAWLVVEKMRERGWNFSVCNGPDALPVSWLAQFWSGEDANVYQSYGDSPAHAICLAALQAVGEPSVGGLLRSQGEPQ